MTLYNFYFYLLIYVLCARSLYSMQHDSTELFFNPPLIELPPLFETDTTQAASQHATPPCQLSSTGGIKKKRKRKKPGVNAGLEFHMVEMTPCGYDNCQKIHFTMQTKLRHTLNKHHYCIVCQIPVLTHEHAAQHIEMHNCL